MESIIYPSLEFVEQPFDLFARLRAEAPVYKISGRDEYLVSRYEDILQVAGHPETFSNQVVSDMRVLGWPGRSMVMTDPPELAERRALVGRVLTASRRDNLALFVERTVDELIDRFASRGRAEFCSEFAHVLSLKIMLAVLGLPTEDDEIITGRRPPHASVETRYQQDTRLEQVGPPTPLTSYLRTAVLQRCDVPTGDPLSRMIELAARSGQTLDLADVFTELGIVMNAGIVTSAHMLANTLVLLLSHRDELTAVREDQDLIPNLIEESVRLESPLQWQPRRAVADTELAGVKIPERSLVLMLLASGNRDEAVFAHPDTFDVRRANANANIAFSAGAHACLGRPLARLTGRIAMERILARLPGIRFAPGQTKVARQINLTHRGPVSVAIEFDQ